MKPITYAKLAILAALAVTSAIATAAETAAGESALRRHSNVDKSGLALQGHDPVAYFTQKHAVRGNPRTSAAHATGTYLFSSPENRDLFLKDPIRYLPAYGGWCATAMAEGRKVEIDPENFKITGNRLFLFYKSFIANALNDWNEDEANLTKKADEHWNRLFLSTAAASNENAVATGRLEGRGGHKMSGTATIVEEAAGYRLVLESDFVFDGAPAPRLGLGKGGYKRETKFSNLKANKGTQSYALPANVDPKKYDELWVWCDKFNVPLGTAKLNFDSSNE